jgi:CheY-like chemotaxis protein
MEKLLRVLLVKDSAEDAALLVRCLKRAGYAPTTERVETAEAMNAALERGTWDIILSDHRMPLFSAFGALRLVRERALDVPFIVVSGNIGDATRNPTRNPTRVDPSIWVRLPVRSGPVRSSRASGGPALAPLRARSARHDACVSIRAMPRGGSAARSAFSRRTFPMTTRRRRRPPLPVSLSRSRVEFYTASTTSFTLTP